MWACGIVVVLVFLGTASCLPTGRVVNGTDSSISKYPFMASLREPMGSHSCGGTIIAPSWVLTAAHCVDVAYALNQTIQYGVTDVAVEGPNVVPIKRIIMHHDYSPEKGFINDIALIELAGKLVYNYRNIAPVTLPEENFEIDQLAVDVPGVLAGWGLNSTFGERQKTLQEVDLKIYSDKACQNLFNNATNNDQICGGVDDGVKGACSSDSGGPLIYNGSLQVGVVSYGRIPCGSYPGVYAKVSHYIGWINRHIR